MRENSRGARSQRTTSARGSSSTVLDVTISPPSDDRRAASASTSVCDPPRRNGQPSTCAAAQSTKPKPALPARSSGTAECAALPAKSARARSVVKSRAIARALSSPRTSDGRRREHIPARPALRPCAHERLDERAVALRVRAEAVGACAGARARASTASPSSACAAGTGGSIQSSSSPANAGERRASGSTAAQTSWRKPGSVSSAVRQPPPTRCRSLVHGHVEAGLRELHRAREPVRPGADDDRALHARAASRPARA